MKHASFKVNQWMRRGAKIGFTLLLACLWLPLPAQEPKKAAIFVDNRTGLANNHLVPMLEDMVSSRVSDTGFRVISRELSANAISTYDSERSPKLHDTNLAYSAKLDDFISNQSSAARLAQNLGADMLLFVSLVSLGTDERKYEDPGLKLKFTSQIHNLRVSYKILEAWSGGSFAGDSITKSKTIRQTANLQNEVNPETVNQLLDEAAQQIADDIRKNSSTIASVTSTAPKLVRISIQTRMNDLVNVPVTVPVVQMAADGRAVVMSKAEVQALDVMVELDGLNIGSAPGEFSVVPGLHKIRFNREGFKPQEMSINCFEKQSLIVSMQMTDAAFNRWKENLSYLSDLEKDKKLTDAEIKKIEGIAKMFSESGYKVSIKEDVKKDYKADVKGFLLKGPIDSEVTIKK